MMAPTSFDRVLLRAALKVATQSAVPVIGVRTETMKRLLGYVAVLEERAGVPAEARISPPGKDAGSTEKL